MVKKTKIVFTDNGQDKAIVGTFVSEDDSFIYVISGDTRYTIAKRVVVCMKELNEGETDGRFK